MIFKRFERGDVVNYNGKKAIVQEEQYPPYIDGNKLILGKYTIHTKNGYTTVGAESLEKSSTDTSSEDSFDERFEIFFKGCKKIYSDYMDKNFPENIRDEFSYKKGRRYMKVIRGGSVHCFVDRKNGNVLKAASWNAPAKHARGNIFESDNGLGCMREFGTVYLKG